MEKRISIQIAKNVFICLQQKKKIFLGFFLTNERKKKNRKKKKIFTLRHIKSFSFFSLLFLEGDSGGPLMILNQTDNRWYLFGITSHGANTETIKPGVYSSISTKLDFIKIYL
jgi:secreted trypsin-like serine protease